MTDVIANQMVSEDFNNDSLDEYSGESDYSDPEDFVDDVPDEELMPDVLHDAPQACSDNEKRIIVVDNVPKVDSQRYEKLSNLLIKLFSKSGEVELVSNHFPKDKEGKTIGSVFFEYTNPKAAMQAVKEMDNYKLDRSHTFKVNLISDFMKYESIDESLPVPAVKPFEDHGDIRYFLQDEDCNDQFCVIYGEGERTAIYLNKATEPVVLQDRHRWTEQYVRWSPKGAYLATLHSKGIALWGGPDFKRIARFMHEAVNFIDFSPCERYIVTLSPTTGSVKIWEIFTGLMKRPFEIDMNKEENLRWPIFKWSHDDKFFARRIKGAIQVYETPSMRLVDNKSITVQNVSQFSWSPKANKLAYWVAEQNQIPARVVIVQLPSKAEVRVKNLFNVKDIRLNWHNQGRFLCVKVDRFNKTKKNAYSTFEIFRMDEKQVPVDIIELKEQVQAFAWEPNGNKFCCLHGIPGYTSASFYEIKNDKIELIATLERKSASHIFWSPAGQFVLLASVDSPSTAGTLEFVDTGDMTVMNANEHMGATDVEWDPTGRFVVTTASCWSCKDDSAAWIWSFQGRLLKKFRKEKLCQLLWRPRPPTLLSPQNVKKIKKELKKYSKEFDVKDRLLQSRVSKEILDKRRELMDQYREYRQLCAMQYKKDAPLRRELRNDVNTDEIESRDGEDMIDLQMEVALSEETQIITDETNSTTTKE